VGHPYNLDDPYLNHNLIRRLEQLNVQVCRGEAVPLEHREQGVAWLTGEPYWSYALDLVGSAAYYLRLDAVDGLIAVVAFGCAPDSGILAVLNKATAEAEKPFLTLMLDEHAGEAGLITRIEAFVDMLGRRKESGRLSRS